MSTDHDIAFGVIFKSEKKKNVEVVRKQEVYEMMSECLEECNHI